MAKVFLSYDREDVDKARPVAAALEKAGHTVWWDQHIRGGAQFSQEIDRALKDADAIVVLWSRESVESPWVRDEAAVGRDRGCLVPACLDGTAPPLGFRQFQVVTLSNGRGRAAALRQLTAAVETFNEPGPKPSKPSAPEHSRRSRVWLGAAAVGIVLLGFAAFWLFRSMPTVAPVVSVRPAEASSGSRALARDLFVRLGDYQSSHPEALELTDDSAKRPDLIVEVSASPASEAPSANLVVLRGKDRMLLSSEDIEAPNGLSVLYGAVGASAARIVGCATDTLRARPQLRNDVLKLYLASCARFPRLYGSDDISLILPQLEQITRREPKFLPAWRRLLLGGAALVPFPSDQPKPPPSWLRQQVDRARKIDPAMPEIGVAELVLLPTRAFAERLEKIESIRREAPDDPALLDVHAEELMTVGRMTDALGLAERASLLDPVSPAARAIYVRALAYSGRLPTAMEKVRESEPLTIGSKNLLEARFRLNMRYGDAVDALKLLRQYGTSKAHEAFLLARLEPSPANVDRAISVARSVSTELKLYGNLAEVQSAFGRTDDAYAMLMSLRPDQVDSSLLAILFRPVLKDLRQKPRFLQIARRFGLLGYWRTSGKWPDFCSDPDLPYDCRMEAAKLK